MWCSQRYYVGSATVPKVDIGIDSTICPGSDIVLSNAANKQALDIYRWSHQSTGINITVNSPGIYWLQSSNLCDLTTDSVLVSFKDSCACFPFYPEVNLGSDIDICEYDNVTIKNSIHQNGFHYNWINGSSERGITIKTNGVYWVDVSTYCGTIRDSILINPKLSGCERTVYIPNVFTPNNDGKNDLFRPFVFGVPDVYEFAVYNRSGQIVFQTTEILKGWDGRFNGRMQDLNVFVWRCTYKFSGERTVYKKGTMILIK